MVLMLVSSLVFLTEGASAFIAVCMVVWTIQRCLNSSITNQKVSDPHPDQLKILHSCCLFCNAAYDDNIKDDKKLMNAINSTSENFMDWSNDNNRSISFITNMNAKSLKLSNIDTLVKVLVMSFRGTSNLEEVVEDIKSYKSKSVEINYECHFEGGAGFIDAYNDIKKMTVDKEPMLNVFCKMASDHCCGRVLIVGHSLGGAMAQAMASELSLIQPNFKIAVVTFGQPRLFSSESASKKWTFEHWRAINDSDPVPTLPPCEMEFCHHGKAFHFNTNKVILYYFISYTTVFTSTLSRVVVGISLRTMRISMV